jgi:hypothetical protein
LEQEPVAGVGVDPHPRGGQLTGHQQAFTAGIIVAVIRTGLVMPATRFSRLGSGMPHSVIAS